MSNLLRAVLNPVTLLCCAIAWLMLGYIGFISAPGIEPGFGLSQPASERLVNVMSIIFTTMGLVSCILGILVVLGRDEDENTDD